MNALTLAVLNTQFRVAISKKTCTESGSFSIPGAATAIWNKHNKNWIKSTKAIDKKVPATETAVCTIPYETTHQFGLWTNTTNFSKGTEEREML